jgi:N-acetylglucosamine-6-phosphate deacetylase
MTLAPELDGALKLIDLLHARGVVLRGHTDATAEQAARLRPRAATVTHLFNDAAARAPRSGYCRSRARGA